MAMWNRFSVEIGPLFARTREPRRWVVVRAAVYAQDRRMRLDGHELVLKDAPFFADKTELTSPRAPFGHLVPGARAYAVHLPVRRRSTLVFELRAPEDAPEERVWVRFLLCSARMQGKRVIVPRKGLEMWRTTTVHAGGEAVSTEDAVRDIESWVGKELARIGEREVLLWHTGKDLVQFKRLAHEFAISNDALRSRIAYDAGLRHRCAEVREVLRECVLAYEGRDGKRGDAEAERADRILRGITKRALFEKVLAIEKEAERARKMAKAA